MAITLASLKKKADPKMPIVLVHGTHGLGKTSFGAAAPDPVAILTEDGLAKIEMQHFPVAASYEDVMDAIAALYNEEHDRKTLVFDSLDHFEPLVWNETCRRNNYASIEAAGGQGLNQWGHLRPTTGHVRNSTNTATEQAADRRSPCNLGYQLTALIGQRIRIRA